MLKLVSGLSDGRSKKMSLMIDGELDDDEETLSQHVNEHFVEKIDKITKEFPPKPVESSKHAMDFLKGKKIGNFAFKTASYSFVKKVTMGLNNVESTASPSRSTRDSEVL